LIAAGIAATVLFAAAAAGADEIYEPGKWNVGTQAGVQMKTAAGSVFTMGVNVDYRVSPQISVGPLAFASSGVDLTEYALAATARYSYAMGSWNVIPFAGLGMISAEFKEAKSSVLYIPIGVTAEYAWRGNVFTATVMGGFHKFEFEDVNPAGDPKSLSIMLGVRL
jgi:hypothetical protein